MKKITFSICLILALAGFQILVSASLCAQTLSSNPITRIIPSQAGTLSIEHGTATVELNKAVLQALSIKEDNASYYVVLTPIATDAVISLSDKGDHSFSVKANSNSSVVKVDYVVFVQKTSTINDLHEFKKKPTQAATQESK